MRTCERHTDCAAADKRAIWHGRCLGAPHGPKYKFVYTRRRAFDPPPSGARQYHPTVWENDL